MPEGKDRIAYWIKKALDNLDEVNSALNESTWTVGAPDGFDDAVEEITLTIDRELKPKIEELLTLLT